MFTSSWVHAYILINYKVKCSASFVYTIFRYLGIQSKTKHKKRSRPRKVKDKYPKDTFSKRELTEEPKFVRKKRDKRAESEKNQGVSTAEKDVSTSENASEGKTSDMSTIKNDI